MIGAQDQGLLSVAEAHCLRALEYGTAAPAKDKAKALLREIRRARRCRSFSPPLVHMLGCVPVPRVGR